jgi:hypothetical protein
MSQWVDVSIEIGLFINGFINSGQAETPAERVQAYTQLASGIQGLLWSIPTAIITDGVSAQALIQGFETAIPVIASGAVIVDIGTQMYVFIDTKSRYDNGDPNVSENDVGLAYGKLAMDLALLALILGGGGSIAAVSLAIALSNLAFDQMTQPGTGFWWLVNDIISPLISFLSDPLVLDLDSDGIELTALTTSTTHFDLNANGFAEHTGWVAPDDGLLVIDRNRNNRVDSVAELFGSATQDGFAVLETLDDNHDGIINTADAAFADLKVWRDLNQNGVSEAGELFTLSALGIQSISVQTQHVTGVNQGHSLGVTAQFTRQNGTAGAATSVYFQTDGQNTTPNEQGFTPANGVANLPQLPRSGNLHSIAWMANSIKRNTLTRELRI